MKRLILVAAVFVSLVLLPASAYAHHVGAAEDSMPADQWEYVDGVAHGASADGNADMDTAPGDEAGAGTMNGERNLLLSGQANMNTP